MPMKYNFSLHELVAWVILFVKCFLSSGSFAWFCTKLVGSRNNDSSDKSPHTNAIIW